MVRRVVGAGDHDAAIRLRRLRREVKHRRRPAADPMDGEAGRHQPGDEGAFQGGGAQPSVVAHHHLPAAGAHDPRAEGTPDGVCIGLCQRLANDAADVIFAKNARVELVGSAHGT